MDFDIALSKAWAPFEATGPEMRAAFAALQQGITNLKAATSALQRQRRAEEPPAKAPPAASKFADAAIRKLLAKFGLAYVGEGAGSYSSMSGWSRNYYFTAAKPWIWTDENKKEMERAFLAYEKKQATEGTNIDAVYFFDHGESTARGAPANATAYVYVRYGRSIRFGG
jgi:hypothetical protein